MRGFIILALPVNPNPPFPLLAHSGHAGRRLSRQLSGVKQPRLSLRCAAANDPKRTIQLEQLFCPFCFGGHGTVP